MSTPARIRVLLVIAVAILAASVSLVLSAQRANLTRGQAQTAVAGDLLSAMLDQETAVRGFDQTGLEEFLEPYGQGRAAFAAALVAADRSVDGADTEPAEHLARQAAIARKWQELADHAIAQVRGHGSHTLTVEGARARKALMDDFRRENAEFRKHLAAHVDEELEGARRSAIGIVVLIGTLLLGGGLLLVEHGAPRGGAAPRRAGVHRDAAGRRRRGRGAGHAPASRGAVARRHRGRHAPAQRERQPPDGRHRGRRRSRPRGPARRRRATASRSGAGRRTTGRKATSPCSRAISAACLRARRAARLRSSAARSSAPCW